MTTQAAQSGQGGQSLPPLEYSDCFLDSPTFREVIVLYEKEMESNYYLVKNLVKQCDSMIQATKGAGIFFFTLIVPHVQKRGLEKGVVVKKKKKKSVLAPKVSCFLC